MYTVYVSWYNLINNALSFFHVAVSVLTACSFFELISLTI